MLLTLYTGDKYQHLREICYPNSILSSNQDNFEYQIAMRARQYHLNTEYI